ncbi:osmoprotectant transport system permease protein [Streptomyces sp. DvalAA-14]|uniref:ABC transporter permease n=1 Tax=unclassified Streptomyces TaxID=2593676 RepID=UPI00081B10A1|nr:MULTISPECIES: ABC transporter permease [unclassified Streptomyces]MYS20580.1 ABC transporter permease subunit [Streptomyces sp. SID4948]SCD72246.1 osmoprotectant transport system permease protein [Streptomyces sp. DvalAA-14]
MASENCMVANDWICGEYLRSYRPELTDAVIQHIWITAASVAIGLLVAFPLALVARRWRLLAGPVLAVTTVLYTVPSLAMFSLLLPVFGISPSLVVTGLVLYSLTILVRNILAGLAAVPEDVREAARAMGYGPTRQLFAVELPLALPAVMAGLRIATVSTVALTTVGAIIDYGGLGNLLLDGINRNFKAQVLAASVLCVLIALVADGLLLGLQWLITPWTHRGRGRAGRPAGPVTPVEAGAGADGLDAETEKAAAA